MTLFANSDQNVLLEWELISQAAADETKFVGVLCFSLHCDLLQAKMQINLDKKIAKCVHLENGSSERNLNLFNNLYI